MENYQKTDRLKLKTDGCWGDNPIIPLQQPRPPWKLNPHGFTYEHYNFLGKLGKKRKILKLMTHTLEENTHPS